MKYSLVLLINQYDITDQTGATFRRLQFDRLQYQVWSLSRYTVKQFN